jgi:hypothetical protein
VIRFGRNSSICFLFLCVSVVGNAQKFCDLGHVASILVSVGIFSRVYPLPRVIYMKDNASSV